MSSSTIPANMIATNGEPDFQVANPENEFLLRLVKGIMTRPGSNRSEGWRQTLEVCQRLCECKQKLQSVLPPEWHLSGVVNCIGDVEPTTELVFNDLAALDDTIVTSVIGENYTVPGVEVLASILDTAGSPEDSNHSKQSFLAASDISATPYGLGQCEFKYPHEPEGDFVLCGITRDGTYQTFTAAVTKPHHTSVFQVGDFSLSQFTIHFHGVKLWIAAPYSRKNAFHLGKNVVYRGDIDGTLKHLSMLEGLVVWLCDKPCSFVVPAGYFHMCVTVDYSFHTRVAFASLSTFNHVRDVMSNTMEYLKFWEMTTLSMAKCQLESWLVGGNDEAVGKRAVQNGGQVTLALFREDTEEGMDMIEKMNVRPWKKLIENNPRDDIFDWIFEVEEWLDGIEKKMTWEVTMSDMVV